MIQHVTYIHMQFWEDKSSSADFKECGDQLERLGDKEGDWPHQCQRYNICLDGPIYIRLLTIASNLTSYKTHDVYDVMVGCIQQWHHTKLICREGISWPWWLEILLFKGYGICGQKNCFLAIPMFSTKFIPSLGLLSLLLLLPCVLVGFVALHLLQGSCRSAQGLCSITTWLKNSGLARYKSVIFLCWEKGTTTPNFTPRPANIQILVGGVLFSIGIQTHFPK